MLFKSFEPQDQTFTVKQVLSAGYERAAQDIITLIDQGKEIKIQQDNWAENITNETTDKIKKDYSITEFLDQAKKDQKILNKYHHEHVVQNYVLFLRYCYTKVGCRYQNYILLQHHQ